MVIIFRVCCCFIENVDPPHPSISDLPERTLLAVLNPADLGNVYPLETKVELVQQARQILEKERTREKEER